jgi:RNA polymerase sigma factor (sigma-70 family)
MDLIRDHLGGSSVAFTQIVDRHVDMVYSAALRQVRDAHLADDVTQAVFLLLWQKAGGLGAGTIVSAWLHRAAGYCAANALRIGAARKRHELKAAHMSARETSPQAHAEDAELSAVLDRAVARLSSTDRAAVIMRYFEGKTAEDVAIALHVTPEAARKRVERAVMKLQEILAGLGVTTATPALTGFLAKRAILPSPPQVAAGVQTTIHAAASGAVATTTGAAGVIAKGALVTMTAKTQFVAVTGIILLLLLGGAGAFMAASGKHSITGRTPASNIVRVQAYIDGRSRLCIRGNTVHWSNLEFSPPGQQGGGNRPTYLNGQRWIPAWTILPFTTLSVSDEYKKLDPPLPQSAGVVSINPIDVRGRVWIVQQPKATNRYTLILEFDDAVAGGAVDYTVDLTFPSTADAGST